ncbi:hypothetical protein D3C72_1433580 [compost metagenome]
MLGLRVFNFVVADAVLARHEDHGGRRHRGHVDRIVSSARHDVHGGQMALGRALAHLVHQVGVERCRAEILHVFQIDLHAMGHRDVIAGAPPLLVHARQGGFVFVTQVGGKPDLARDDVARSGVRVDFSHGAAPMRLMRVGNVDYRLHQKAGGEQGVAADRHRGGSGMHFHARYGDVVPAQAK